MNHEDRITYRVTIGTARASVSSRLHKGRRPSPMNINVALRFGWLIVHKDKLRAGGGSCQI